MPTTFRILLRALIVAALTGCGQRGPLYLPAGAGAATPQAAAAAASTPR